MEPLWTPGDGDVLVIAADELAGSLGPLLDDLLERGFHPACARRSRITAAYLGAGEAEAIRLAVSDACASFRSHPLALILVGTASEDDPGRNLLSTVATEYEQEFPGSYDSTYAEDPLFGDILESPDLEPELMVGRIPARTPAELAAYVAKLEGYRIQVPRSKLLLAVGDASINHNNSDRTRAAGRLVETALEGGVVTPSAQYAAAYTPLSEASNRQRALADFQNRLAAGVGLLEIFGNNTRATNIVHMFESPPGPLQPWLLPEQMPTAGKLPIALFHTCLNGAFDEDGLFSGYDAPAESWVRDPARGVIAAVAQSHITTYFDDWELADRFLRRLARRNGVLLGALHAGVRWDLLSQTTRGERSLHSVRMGNLLGDPLLEPRLGIVQKRLDGTFETPGSWPDQNHVCWDRGWTTAGFDSACASARIAYGGVPSLPCAPFQCEPVFPVRGSRMLRITGSHASGAGRRAAAWTIFRCDLEVERGSLLSYWIRQDEDPRGIGRLCLDAVTASGRILSRELLDASGRCCDPQRVQYALGRWHRVAIRLDPWERERIRALFVRYDDPLRPGEAESPAADGTQEEKPRRGNRPPLSEEPLRPGGAFAGTLDEVRIDTGYNEPLVDGEFSTDEDGDRHPDLWYASVPTAPVAGPTPAVAIRDEGPVELWLDPSTGSAGGAGQNLGPFRDPTAAQFLRFEARTNDGGSLRVLLLDPLTGELIDQIQVGPLSTSWREGEALFPAIAHTPCFLHLAAVGGSVGVRSLRVESAQTSDLRAEEVHPSRGKRVRIAPNPSGGEFRITWNLDADRPSQIDLLDVTGRRVAVWRPSAFETARRQSFWSPRNDRGRVLPSGTYFLRIVNSSGTETRTVHLVR
jgi:hypothetical protein